MEDVTMVSVPQERAYWEQWFEDNLKLVFWCVRKETPYHYEREDDYQELVHHRVTYAYQVYVNRCRRELSADWLEFEPHPEATCRRFAVQAAFFACKSHKPMVGHTRDSGAYVDAMNRRKLQRIPVHGTDRERKAFRPAPSVPCAPDPWYGLQADNGFRVKAGSTNLEDLTNKYCSYLVLDGLADNRPLELSAEELAQQESVNELLLRQLKPKVRRSLEAIMENPWKKQIEIAAELGIPDRTLRNHVRRAFEILGPYFQALAQRQAS
jgi:hypothetical protein